jgi:hypothetical protein
MSGLQSTLQSLAASFAADVVRAIQGSSLQDLLGEVSGGKGRGPAAQRTNGAAVHEGGKPRGAAGKRPRLKRRTPDDIAATLQRIVSLLGDKPDGLRAEQIRVELGVEAKELPRPLADGIAARTLRKKGQKRATVYFVSNGTEAPRPRRKTK